MLSQQRRGRSRAEASSGRQHPMEVNTKSWQFLIAAPMAGRAWSLGGWKQARSIGRKTPRQECWRPQVRQRWEVPGECRVHTAIWGSTILTGRRVPPPSLGSVHLGSRIREKLGVDGKVPRYWTSWNKAVAARKCGWTGESGKDAGEMSAELLNTRTCPPHFSWAIKWDKCSWVNSRKVLTFQKSFAVLRLINLY